MAVRFHSGARIGPLRATFGRWLPLLALCAACGPAKELAQPAPLPQAAPPPDWVTARPISSLYYIGIGQCPKSRPDYRETAKQNALNDLASEISVTVQGNSLLYALDRTGSFKEEFLNTVKTSTAERMEGYELVGSYDGPQDHFTYYRLNKASHAELKKERARQTIASALDLHARGRTAWEQGDLRSALDLELRALASMKERWGEMDTVTWEGRAVPLSNMLYAGLQDMVAGVRLAAEPNRITLDLAHGFHQQISIEANLVPGGQAAVDLPFQASWPGGDAPITLDRTTDAQGQAIVDIQHPDLATARAEVVLRTDPGTWLSTGADPAVAPALPLLAGLRAPELRLPLAVHLPSVHLSTLERNLGTTVPDGPCTSALKELLAAHGFRTTADKRNAELWLELRADATAAGGSNGFRMATADAALTATMAATGQVLYHGGRTAVKGIQLTDDKAGMDALKKAGQQLESALFPAFLQVLFQP
jgi:hypothetical protein